ncbi:hypothetical protein COLO4_30392 [Corchorus olitorius]|uniref:non-specific serine/threonine protein kinase n=1 Tax=Corchorus olitorius TaxID=93759 RepID=A0A1R3H934_9ROSI|nr:hypothetical protein COLO4_30392 [Corchorus olitorius]
MANGGQKLVLLLLSFCLLLIDYSYFASGRDTIGPGQRLEYQEHLSSGNFILGFFFTSDYNGSYLGIWYNYANRKEEEVLFQTSQTEIDKPVWVANRDNPLTKGSLSIDSNGSLMIVPNNGDEREIFTLYHSGNAPVNTSATLQDDGIDSLSVVSCDLLRAHNNWNGFGLGCAKLNLPECRTSYPRFEKQNGVMSSNGYKFSESENLTLFDCHAKCSTSCSCVAYASVYDDQTGCQIWSSEAIFRKSASNSAHGHEIYLLKKGAAEVKQRILLNELGVSAMPALSSGKPTKNQKKDRNDLCIFSFESIAVATNYFSTANQIGKGGFGPVYKGDLSDGREVAIKRLSRSSGQGMEEFKKETILIAKLQHTNLVRLLGFCIQADEKILVYDGYMSPEYAFHGVVSVKTDVFSFGVLILEVVSGRKNSSQYHSEHPLNLTGYVKSDGSKNVLWQSFDYPTDTLLPGMKLGIDFKTGHKWSLTSWISDEVPATGSFTLGGDPSASQLIIWWQGNIYWTSGNWRNSSRGFAFVPELSTEANHEFSYIANENQRYFAFSVNKNINRTNLSSSYYSIASSGEILEGSSIAPFGRCFSAMSQLYSSPWSVRDSGCISQTVPECRRFSVVSTVKLKTSPGGKFKFDEYQNMSLYDCGAKCYSDCSCVAFASDKQTASCEIWSPGLSFKSYSFTKQTRQLYSIDKPG